MRDGLGCSVLGAVIKEINFGMYPWRELLGA